MRYFSIISLICAFSSCSSIPQLYQTVDDIATDDAITIKVDRDAIKPNTNVYLNLRVLNKENPAN